MSAKIFYIGILALIGCTWLHFQPKAQDNSVSFEQLTTVNGLSQSSVIAIAQDQQGMLWFGTRDGLNKYDGGQFTVFRHNPKDTNSLSNNDILSIAVDEIGDIWIGTYNGLNHYDVSQEVFTRYLESAADPNSLSNNTIWSLEVVSPSEILIGTSEGLNILNPQTGIITRYFHKGANASSLSHDGIRALYKDKIGQVWVGTENGLNRLIKKSDGSITFDTIELPSELVSDQPDFIQAIHEYDSSLWVGSKFKGLYELNLNGVCKRQFLDASSKGSVINNNIRAITTDQQNRLWIGTYEGLNVIKESREILTIVNNSLNKNALSENKVKSLYCSKNGSIWVGTYYGGINMWNQANFNFSNLKMQVGGLGLSYNVISSIVETPEQIFFGTEGRGINAMNKTNGGFSNITQINNGLTSDNIKALRKGRDKNQMWVCTFDKGLNLLNTTSRDVIKVLDTSSGLSSNSVYDFIEFANDFWVIGTFGGGINIYNPQNDSVTYVIADGSQEESLTDNQVRTLMRDDEGNIWIGTQKGLCLWTAHDLLYRNFRFQRFFYDMTRESGDDIRVIFEDSKGNIWVGSKETGLHMLDGNGFRSVDLFSDQNGMSNTIHAIEEDQLGNLWISSNNGIVKYNPQTDFKKIYEESDGVGSNEFNSNSSLNSESGIMYFGGPNGVTSFNPNLLKENKTVSQVWLSELKVNNKLVMPGDNSGVLTETISNTSSIKLAYDQANFNISFALPSFVNPKKNEFVYRLKGLEQDWNISSIPQATYNIQNSGDYVFEVRGVNNDGYVSDTLTQLEIQVLPAPWRSIWAFILYSLVVAGSLLILFRMIRSKTQLQYELDLEHKTNLQQEELNKLKLQFFTNISHEFRTPLTLILGPLDQIIENFKGSSVIFKQLKTMQQSANQLLKLINQLMDFRKIDNRQDELKAAEGNIVKFVHEIFLSFKIYAKDGKYDYSFETERDDIQVYFDRDKLERVLYNLISNAFKFTPDGGSVIIHLGEQNEEVVISVADSGRGIAQENVLKIFDRFYQIKSEGHKKDVSSGTGIGLALAKSIIDLHNGQITVQSEMEIGSEFTIRLKKGVSHLDQNQLIKGFKDSEDLVHYTSQEGLEKKQSVQTDVALLVKNPDKKTILVVEDNDQVRTFILNLLMSKYNLLEASDGQKGLDLAIREVPDLIISDVMMPIMDGIEFCTRAKSEIKTSHVPFILLTARTSLIFKYEGLESGADDYINKPFNVKELELKVKNMLHFVSNLKKKFKESSVITPSEVTISSIDEEMLNKAIQIVDDNIENEFFDVNLFATELGVSRTMLFTKVKAWTDMTPNEFILSMRMKRAAQLLEQGKISIAQISYKVGFKDPKYFSKCFNKYHSLSPTQYAEKFV